MTIWCIGDLNYFVAVLNGLAMLASSGMFTDLVRIGLIMAVLWLGFEALFSTNGSVSSGIPFGRLIVAFIAFKLLFGTTTTVVVYDSYSLRSMSVDNVPYGVAMAGRVMSVVAHEITDKLETAFSTPSLASSGFGTPLEILASGSKLAPGLNTLRSGTIKKTLVEYVEKCTCAGINLGQVDQSQIMNSDNPWQALKWDSTIYYAKTWLPGDPADGTLRDCTDAWDNINGYMTGSLWTDWKQFLQSVICPSGTCDPVGEVQGALDNLSMMSSSAQNYMLAAVLLPVFESGQINFDSFMGKPEMAIIVGQAREQRNVQWTAESSLFMTIVRPMMAFFEGFLYATAPLMALLVAFVPAGLGLLGRYLQMFAWIQLWMPVLAILNHYQQIIAQQKLAALVSGTIPLTSMQGYLIGLSTLNDWMATVGLLAASTPAIALALLYGGAVAMTHLAGRLQGGDFVNEKIGAPDVVQPAPALAMAPAYNQDPTRGVHVNSMQETVPKLSVSEVVSNAHASSQQQVVASRQEFSSSLATMMGATAAASVGGSVSNGFSQGTHGQMTESEALATGMAHKIGSGMNLSSQDYHKLSNVLNGGISGKAGVNLGAELQQAFGQEKAQVMQERLDNAVSSSGESSLAAASQKVLAYDASHQQMRQYMQGYNQNDMDKVEQAAQKMESAEKRYQETAEAVHQLGSSSSVDMMQFGRAAMARMGESQLYLQKLGGALPGFVTGTNKMGQNYNRLDELVRGYRGMGVNDEQARWMAITQRLQEYNGPGKEVAQKHLADLVMQTMGREVPIGGADKNQGLASAVEKQGEVAAQKAQGLQPVMGVTSHIGAVRQETMAPLPGPGTVSNFYYDSADRINAQRSGQAEQAWARKYKSTVDAAYEQFAKDPNSAQKTTEASQVASRFFQNISLDTAGAATSTLQAVKSAWDSGDINKLKGILSTNNSDNAFRQYALNQGLNKDQADLYAYTAHRHLAVLARENAGGLGFDYMHDYAAYKEGFIQNRAADLERRGMSPSDSRQVAEKEAGLIMASGTTGMGYMQRIVGSEREWGNLQRQERRMGPIGRYDSIITAAAQKNGVDPDLVRAVIGRESKGNPEATSGKGAQGLMQLMPDTARGLGVTNSYDPVQNIHGGTRYLRQMLEKNGGNYQWALAAYNAGPEHPAVRARNWDALPQETKEYVPKVLNNLRNYKSVPSLGKKTPGIM